MVFRSKVDAFFIKFMLLVVLVIASGSLFPLFIEEVRNNVTAVIVLISTFLLVISFLLWANFSATYIFEKDYLVIKSGPFRYRIPYKNITKVSPTTAIFSGHKALSSRDALEIFNKTTFYGSIKISPKRKKEFMTELIKRCPSLQIQE